jgi:hypothetical protein
MEEWNNGRIEEWKSGRVKEWENGRKSCNLVKMECWNVEEFRC